MALGKRFKISPRLIDFAINDYTAGAGQSINWLLGMGLEAAGYRPEVFGSGRPDRAEEGFTRGEAVSRVPGVNRFLGTRATQEERRGFAQLRTAVEETNREFSRIPGMNELGVRLGEVGDSITVSGRSIELTPNERAEYQRLMAAVVIPYMKMISFQSFGRERVQKELTRLKESAREQMVRKLRIGRTEGVGR